MGCFANNDLFQATSELFHDVLSNYSGFFTPDQYHALETLLDTSWAEAHYQRVTQGNHDEDGIHFGLLLLGYGDAKVEDLMERTDDRSQRLLTRLSGLLACRGYPIVDDMVFVPALEFWSTFTETMIDRSFVSEGARDQIWKPYANQHLQAVVLNCWRKIQWPPVDDFAAWDSADRLAFCDARKEVADLLQSLFTLDGKALVSFFVGLLLRHLPTQNWPELEVSAFCLASLSDGFSDRPDYDDQLTRVFSADLFRLLGQAGQLPLRLRQTALSLLERCSEYFTREPRYLPHALNLLFGAVGDALLGEPSAKAISTLCSSCRSLLTAEVSSFISHYRGIRRDQVIDSMAEERIVLAIASIIQAVADEDQKLDCFAQLYAMIKEDHEHALLLKARPPASLDLSNPVLARRVDTVAVRGASHPAEEAALQLAMRSLRCLSSAAKGLQATEEYPIHLDSEPQAHSRSPGLTSIQDDIMNLIATTHRAFSASSEVVEVTCIILRAGFSETEPGPFVFRPDTVVDFLTGGTSQTPRLGTLLGTACSFVGSLYRGPRKPVPQYLSQLLPWLVSLLRALPGKASSVRTMYRLLTRTKKKTPPKK